MATIGLDKLYYAVITEDPTTGYETYGAPKPLAKAIQADVSTEIASAILYADDGAAESADQFVSGTISLNVADISNTAASELLGEKVDANGAVVSTSQDIAPYVAIAFRGMRSDGNYEFFWLYRVKFKPNNSTLQTKGDSITFNTPTIEGTVTRRNKPDADGQNPWRVYAVQGRTGVSALMIANWYTAVYESVSNDTAVQLTALTIGTVSLTPTFSATTTSYTASTSSATNTVTATAGEGADVVITVNGDSLTSGTSASWETGENEVKVVVTKGTQTKTYIVTVTKGA